MSDFLLELLSEENPARMQGRARADLVRLFEAELAEAGLAAEAIETYSTPRRLALIARGLPAETQAVSEERRGPRADAPDKAIEGFLRSTGLERGELEEREEKKGTFLYAVIDTPGRETRTVLADAIPKIVRNFPWPKSMRWGAASVSTESLRWVRPLQGIVAIFGDDLVECEIGGIASGFETVGHRFHHPGRITIGGADDYLEKLEACHVIVDHKRREGVIRERADALAGHAGLVRLQDSDLVEENAGLTEWPMPLLGSFDPAFLEVAPEAITLAMRTHQKYFACEDGEGDLAPNFICVANIEAADGGEAITRGNERVLAARLADAKFFWEQDLATPLEEQARKLNQILFHEKLGTVADKVDRVAKLARWLVEEGIVKPSPPSGGEGRGGEADEGSGGHPSRKAPAASAAPLSQPSPPKGGEGYSLADKAETAARLAKADLVTGTVGEFPELQGIVGGYLAEAQRLDPEIAAAIRDHYKPVGQGDEVPTAPVTVAVSLADKLDTLSMFFAFELLPTGSRDPFALRRAAIGVIELISKNDLRIALHQAVTLPRTLAVTYETFFGDWREREGDDVSMPTDEIGIYHSRWDLEGDHVQLMGKPETMISCEDVPASMTLEMVELRGSVAPLLEFFADRLKVQQREAGARHDLIDAVFALGGEDDLVRLLARVRALQDFLKTADGANLLAAYKRAANILKKEGWEKSTPATSSRHSRESGSPASADEEEQRDSRLRGNDEPGYDPQPEEHLLREALSVAEREADAAIAAEDFEGAMAALAGLCKPIDAFFDHVTVNDEDPEKREARLQMLERMRDAVHRVADFSKVEG